MSSTPILALPNFE
jgi:hypothetical protein